jgi:hypothetical protein
MFPNLLVLLLFIGLIVLFGWLTYRAIRARKLWVKIVGSIAAGLATLLLTAVAFFGAKGVAATYFPSADPAPQITVAGTLEQVARGEYLVNLSCIGCHSAVGPDGAPSMQHPLSGGVDMAGIEGFGFISPLSGSSRQPGNSARSVSAVIAANAASRLQAA